MLVLFLHGWQSTPGGVKPTFLKSNLHEVVNPALPDDDFDAALRIAQAEFNRYRPDVVVGSSRGGAVAMNINSGNTPLVLLCPAWKRWGTARVVKPGTVILHSQADEVIPFADSRELLRNSGLSELRLVAVGQEHRLADPQSLKKMLTAVERAPIARCSLFGREEAGVPRRFGVGTLLLITTMFAVLFAVLRALGVPALVFAGIALFFMAVGLGQMLLFKGERPRRASITTGAFLGAGFPVFCWALHCALGPRFAVSSHPLDSVVGAFGGAFYGYLAGILIAGVFLMIDKLKRVRDKFKGRG